MGSFLFRLTRVMIVLGVSLAGAFWLFNAKQVPDKKVVETPPPGVSVEVVAPGNETMVVEAFGTVVPRTRVNLAAEVAGRIDYLHPSFKEGGRIKTGDILIRIDQRSFRLDRRGAAVRLEQAQSDIRQLARQIENLKADEKLARTNMELSRKEVERVRALSRNQFASKTSLDKAEQQYLAARIQLQSVKNGLALSPSQMALKKAALAAAENDLAKAELILEKSEIKSVFDGFVLSKQAEMGEFVNPGQILGAVYEAGALDVDVGIPLEEVRWLRPVFEAGNMPAVQVSIANLVGEKSRVWGARVARIKARIDEKTRTLPMTIEIGPSEIGAMKPEPVEIGQHEDQGTGSRSLGILKPGSFVRCTIMGKHSLGFSSCRGTCCGPGTGCLQSRTAYYGFKRWMSSGNLTIMFLSGPGLEAGDRIVSSPLPGARDGMVVSLKQGDR